MTRTHNLKETDGEEAPETLAQQNQPNATCIPLIA